MEQSGAVLDAVADYSTDLATFVASSDVVINDTVNKIFAIDIRKQCINIFFRVCLGC